MIDGVFLLILFLYESTIYTGSYIYLLHIFERGSGGGPLHPFKYPGVKACRGEEGGEGGGGGRRGRKGRGGGGPIYGWKKSKYTSVHGTFKREWKDFPSY
jgi:hypothetical protein